MELGVTVLSCVHMKFLDFGMLCGSLLVACFILGKALALSFHLLLLKPGFGPLIFQLPTSPPPVQENRDVADARAMLARSWRLRREDVHVHGLKDRRGITYQHAAWRV